jgi:predicted nucleic acid-binding protein
MIVFLDSSTIIYGLEFEDSNSAIILNFLIEKELQANINEKVIAEVKSYFRSRKGRNYAYLMEVFLRRNCVVIKNSELIGQMETLKGKIKRKDLEHIATVRLKNLEWLVAYDEDFIAFTEYITPKEFVKSIGLKARTTEY